MHTLALALIGLVLVLRPGSPSAETYKVFRGDGFSFRYPTDWEEGLSQAETTRALVRAVKSQTGYAASCNVNVSLVEGIDGLSQRQINHANHRIHDERYLSRVADIFPDAHIIGYNTKTFLSMQPASSVDLTATVRSHLGSQVNRLFSIMTIRTPNRYVVTCRGEPESFSRAKNAVDLIVSSFLITRDPGLR